MKLIKLENLFEMEYGAPCPIIVADDNSLLVSFFGNSSNDADIGVNAPQEIITIEFIRFAKYSFGMPNEENLSGHPYYKLGLHTAGFFELKESPYIFELREIAQQHPYFNVTRWNNYRHFIITFLDRFFECVSQEFRVQKASMTRQEQKMSLINRISDL